MAVAANVSSRLTHAGNHTQFGNPWHLLNTLMSRFELLDEIEDLFPRATIEISRRLVRKQNRRAIYEGASEIQQIVIARQVLGGGSS